MFDLKDRKSAKLNFAEDNWSTNGYQNYCNHQYDNKKGDFNN